MSGTKKINAPEMLKRIKQLKAHIDTKKEKSIQRAAKKYIKSSHFIKELLKNDIVHTAKDKTLRWNNIVIDKDVAQSIIEGSRKTYHKSVSASKDVKKKRKYTRRNHDKIDQPPKTQQLSNPTTSCSTSINELKGVINAMHYDLDRIKIHLWNIHVDNLESNAKDEVIKSFTQQMGV